MSDYLVEQLRRSTAFYHADCELKMACADRIEDLEAKLAKAVDALDGMVDLFSGYNLMTKGAYLITELVNARTTIAELSSVSCANSKGQDDE